MKKALRFSIEIDVVMEEKTMKEKLANSDSTFPFVLNNCFRNNTRHILHIDVKDVTDDKSISEFIRKRLS